MRFASLRHRRAYFEPDSKREGTSASFDAQASRTRVAARHAAPTPCSQSGHLRRLELAQWRLLPERSIKSGGDQLARGHELQVQRNLRWRCNRRCQALAAGRRLLRRYVKMNYPYAQAWCFVSSRPHSHARTVRTYAFSCMSVSCLLWSVGRLAVRVSVVARAARGRPKKVIVAISSLK